jgi:5-methylcytosine-specific restriction enzyme A
VKQPIRAAAPRIATKAQRLATQKVAAPIYGTDAYREWRRAVIHRANGACEGPACANPFAPGRRYADHKVELKDDGAPFDVSNGQALCAVCHQRKTLEARARRMGLR